MSVQRLTPQEAAEWMHEHGYAYLDVRTVAEFDAGHPLCAYNVPWQVPGEHGLVPNPSFVAEVEAAFGRDAKLVLGCRSGRRSLAAAEALLSAGFHHIVEQRGGFEGSRDPFGTVQEQGWKELGLPCASVAEPGRDYASLRTRS